MNLIGGSMTDHLDRVTKTKLEPFFFSLRVFRYYLHLCLACDRLKKSGRNGTGGFVFLSRFAAHHNFLRVHRNSQAKITAANNIPMIGIDNTWIICSNSIGVKFSSSLFLISCGWIISSIFFSSPYSRNRIRLKF